MTEGIHAASKELKSVFGVLAADVETALALGRLERTDFAERTLLRTYFAQIEGLCFCMRRVSLACADYVPKLLSQGEIAILREKKFTLDKKGEVESAREFSKLLPSILFSLRCFAKVHGAVFQPDTSSAGWCALQEFVKVRNGLEHPKSMADLRLSDEHLEVAMIAAAWWKSTVLSLFQVCDAANTFWNERRVERLRIDRAQPRSEPFVGQARSARVPISLRLDRKYLFCLKPNERLFIARWRQCLQPRGLESRFPLPSCMWA